MKLLAIRLAVSTPQWRGLALDLAELWAEVVFVYPKAFRTFLERARDAPLSMRSDGASYEPGPISSALAIAGIALPALEALHFDFRNSGHYFDCRGPVLCAPLLRRAVFENYFTPLVAPNLTSLAIIINDTWEYEIDAEYFQTLLRSLPLLEILWLENCLPADGWDIVSERRIKLPCLAKLQVAASLSATTSMIETIHHINDYAYVKLNIAEPENEEDASSLASTLRPYLNSVRHDALWVSGYRSPSPLIRMWKLSDKTDHSVNSFTLSISLADGPLNAMVFCENLFAQLSVGQIRDLTICHAQRLNEFDWRDTLSSFRLSQLTQSVQAIYYHLEVQDTGEWASAIADFGSGLLPMFLLEDPVYYTRIVSVTLVGDAQSYMRATSANELQEFMWGSEPERLLSWLRERAGNSVPLKTLRLTGSVYKLVHEEHANAVEMPQDWKVWEEVGKEVQVIDERTLCAPS
ncbi:hypothetical protein PENSPDRAFT_686180 [Peniophora sp. CONT]|nr:hypothetical protein PENSPDRAFT_686180 [Peniophora sp. CONT]